ncbi:MAG TPA: choice-of-anchor D domain-containing protein [Thermomicrobiales bacterium]
MLRHQRSRLPICLAILTLLTLFGTAFPALAAANLTPVASSQAISIPYGTASAITLYASDPDGPAALIYAIATYPQQGALSNFDPVAGTLTYTPSPGYSGADSFTFTAYDGLATSAPAPVQITISPQSSASISTPSLGFGDQPVGTQSIAQNVILRNTGSLPVAIAAIAITGDYSRTHNCLAILYTGESCTISVSFRPSTTGFRSGMLTITDNAAGSPRVVTLGGFGTGDAAFVALTVASSGSGAVTASPPGTATGPGGTSLYLINTVVTLFARPEQGAIFTGWTIDNAFAGWANPLTITMQSGHTAVATFASLPSFSDLPTGQPYTRPTIELAARGIIRGYGDGRVGPQEPALRAQMAALIARSMGWGDESWGNFFTDQGMVDVDLWRNVGTIAHYSVAFGFGDNTFHPVDPVLYSQSISFITRAMVQKGYWVSQPDNPALYPNVPASSGHRQDLATFVHYVGAVPDYPTSGPFEMWNQSAARGWFARALWQALHSYFGVDRVP